MKFTVKPVLRDHSRDQKNVSLKTGGLLTQVNYSEKYALGGSEREVSLTQVVLRTGSTALLHD